MIAIWGGGGQFSAKFYRHGERGERRLVKGTAEDLLLSAAIDYAELPGQRART
jgi:hypothetical protein